MHSQLVCTRMKRLYVFRVQVCKFNETGFSYQIIRGAIYQRHILISNTTIFKQNKFQKCDQLIVLTTLIIQKSKNTYTPS